MPENNKGFTLIEVMIALAAAMIASIVFFAYFSSTSKVFTTQNVAAEVQQTLRAAVHYYKLGYSNGRILSVRW